MHHSFLTLLLTLISLPALAQESWPPKQQLNEVITSFQAAIAEKDSVKFNQLFFHERVPFTGIMSKDTEMSIKKNYAEFEGISVSNSSKFIREICNAKEAQTEGIYDIHISTDGIIASISFDYDFLSDGRMIQWGHEKWNLVFAGGEWLITDVVYSIHFPHIEKFPYVEGE